MSLILGLSSGEGKLAGLRVKKRMEKKPKKKLVDFIVFYSVVSLAQNMENNLSFPVVLLERRTFSSSPLL